VGAKCSSAKNTSTSILDCQADNAGGNRARERSRRTAGIFGTKSPQGRRTGKRWRRGTMRKGAKRNGLGSKTSKNAVREERRSEVKRALNGREPTSKVSARGEKRPAKKLRGNSKTKGSSAQRWNDGPSLHSFWVWSHVRGWGGKTGSTPFPWEHRHRGNGEY